MIDEQPSLAHASDGGRTPQDRGDEEKDLSNLAKQLAEGGSWREEFVDFAERMDDPVAGQDTAARLNHAMHQELTKEEWKQVLELATRLRLN